MMKIGSLKLFCNCLIYLYFHFIWKPLLRNSKTYLISHFMYNKLYNSHKNITLTCEHWMHIHSHPILIKLFKLTTISIYLFYIVLFVKIIFVHIHFRIGCVGKCVLNVLSISLYSVIVQQCYIHTHISCGEVNLKFLYSSWTMLWISINDFFMHVFFFIHYQK